MLVYFANLLTVVIFSTFFCFCRSWYIYVIYMVSVRKNLGLSLCELNNLLNRYLLGKVKTCIFWCKNVMNSRVIFLISVQKKWLFIFFIWYFIISTLTFLCTHYLETAVYGFNRVYAAWRFHYLKGLWYNWYFANLSFNEYAIGLFNRPTWFIAVCYLMNALYIYFHIIVV